MKSLFKILSICALIFFSSKVSGQCTQVCIKSGTVTVTPTGTQSVIVSNPKGTYTVATTYSYVTSAGVNNITTGALSISVSNVGDSNALFNGITMQAGTTINILIPNTTLPAYTYNAQTSTLSVLVNR